MDLFLSIAQSDWSFDQYSLSLDSEYNTTYDLKSSWKDIVLNNDNGSLNNGGGGVQIIMVGGGVQIMVGAVLIMEGGGVQIMEEITLMEVILMLAM